MLPYLLKPFFVAGVAVLIAVILGPIVIPFLSRLKAGQSIREDGPKTHFKKAGTPTMGGIIIITSIYVTLLIFIGKSTEAWVSFLVLLAFGGIGFWDDYIKVVMKRSLGLRARQKLGLQLLAGLIFGLLLMFGFDRGSGIIIPFTGAIIEIGYLYIPFIIIVLMAAANAVNLTDGLDGLAAGVTVFVCIGLAYLSYINNNDDLGIFCIAIAGACLGFLVFNHYPAKVFMGDTGSMALGGGIAAVAAFNHMEVFLLLLGGVYVIETLSVILQVISFQTTGKRIFRMSPLHHHFELVGWKETKVVKLFYVMAIIFVIIGLLSFNNNLV
jgi:phospho-N-acetylmuramoyl-pentapeptide-transferase